MTGFRAAPRRLSRPRQKFSGPPVTDGVSPSFTPSMDPTGPGTSGPFPDLDGAAVDTIERLMSGSSGSVDWFEVVELLDRLRGEGAADSDDLRVRHHVAAAAAVARRVNASLVPTARRRDHHLRVGAAAAAATVVASVGLASADTLPRPLQNVVSHVVAIVGVDVPDGATHPVPVTVPDPGDPGLAPPSSEAPPSSVAPVPSAAPPTSAAGPGAGAARAGAGASAVPADPPSWFRFGPDASRDSGPSLGRGEAPPWRSWSERRDDERSLRRPPADDPRLAWRTAPVPPWPVVPWTPPVSTQALPSQNAVPPTWPFLPRLPAPAADPPDRSSGGSFGAADQDDTEVGIAQVPERTVRPSGRPTGRPVGRPTADRTPQSGPGSWLLGRLLRRPPAPSWAPQDGRRR
jgi:hypothetical protein